MQVMENLEFMEFTKTCIVLPTLNETPLFGL